MSQEPGRQATGWSLRFFVADDTDEWDRLVDRSWNGTLLHSRRYLSYHRDRFTDRSLVVADERGRPVAVLPAAVDPADGTVVTSHPGLTYGGLVHAGDLRGQAVLEVMGTAIERYRAEGFRLLRYKALPAIYHRVPAADDLYALHRLGAALVRRDLSATVDLAHRGPIRHGRISNLRRAERAGVEVRDAWEDCGAFWTVLAGNLTRHGATPTHTLPDIEQLHRLFPDRISLLTARVANEVVAGTVLYAAGPVLHAQYIGASEAGRSVGAVDLVIQMAIERAGSIGLTYFDFGISTEQGGRVLNDGLHGFKTSFGAGATVYDHYEVGL